MNFGFEIGDIVRRTQGVAGDEGLSASLRRELLAEADTVVVEWLKSIGLADKVQSAGPADIDELDGVISRALEMGLCRLGGVPVRNFVALALIGHYMRPETYVESGYYKGSSIFASFFNKDLRKVIGFDPDPSNFRIGAPPEGVTLDLRTADFSTYEGYTGGPGRALAYFDDHINTALRILQSAEKGLKYLIFDDSCGVHGTRQRLWPSMPTLFFIRRHESIKEGEVMRWHHRHRASYSLRDIAGRVTGKIRPTTLECRFDAQLLDQCRRADAAIAAVHKLPDLSDYLFEPSAENHETTQHFVILK